MTETKNGEAITSTSPIHTEQNIIANNNQTEAIHTLNNSPTPPAETKSESQHQKTALITGITGQDGSYLAELLLDKGYIVHGIIRRASTFNTSRVDHIYSDSHERKTRLFLHYGDMTDGLCLYALVKKTLPDEIYNLAAQSHVKVSFEMPVYTSEVDAVGVMRLLEAVKDLRDVKKIRLYQASSSEMYGKVREIPQNENTPFYPRSPYAIAKLHAFWTVVNYREAFGIHASNGILFNHESPRRGETFVTRKISKGVADIKNGKKKCIYLGNLDAKRDWGHAKDYVYMMWLMLQQKNPDDYVIASEEAHSVREFVELAFEVIGIKIAWKGKNSDEIGFDKETGKVLVRVDSNYYRPTEVDILLGNCEKAKRVLGWNYNFSFSSLVKEMVEHDLKC